MCSSEIIIKSPRDIQTSPFFENFNNNITDCMFSIWRVIMNNDNRCFSTEKSENMVKNGKRIYF